MMTTRSTAQESETGANAQMIAPGADHAAGSLLDDSGSRMHDFVRELYPICRSITGDGLRETLRRIGARIPLELHEVPTGTEVFDWTVPREWNIRDAYVKDSRGERLIDFQDSNLHVMGYSIPVDRRMSFAELRPHLFTIPERPDWIPYRTSYYAENWGFCLSERQLARFRDDEEYEVRIDARLEPGSLTYAECLIPGTSGDEMLFSCHACHPSLANDNLSGIVVATALAQTLLALPQRRYSYRFLFLPTVIGPITWLALNESLLPRIRHGLVLTCVGDPGPTTYKRTRRGDAPIDRAVVHVLQHSGAPFEIRDFAPYGYDERQYCSPGIDLDVGCFMRTPNGAFPEYHTSADDVEFVRPESLADSLEKCRRIVNVLEHDRSYLNQNPKCEPQLGRRGIYKGLRGGTALPGHELALLWVLNLSDGEHTLLDIAERARMPFEVINDAAEKLRSVDLLRPAD